MSCKTRSKFGRYLRRRREANRLSLRELAKKAKLHFGLIFRIETGATSPDLETLKRLAKGFDEHPLEFIVKSFAPTDAELASLNEAVTPTEDARVGN